MSRMCRGPFKNALLRSMDPVSIERLQLRRVELPLRQDLETPGETIANLYFVEEGIVSATAAFEDGTQVEVTMFGSNSAIGFAGLMGSTSSINRIFVRLPGYGYAAPLRLARQEFERAGHFHDMALRCVQGQLSLCMQNAACNAMHTYERRLARWLLLCSDCANRNSFEMAQDAVSDLLGSTRSTISIAAAQLKAKGLIGYSRGTIRLLDRPRLEAEACECYRRMRDHQEAFASCKESCSKAGNAAATLKP